MRVMFAIPLGGLVKGMNMAFPSIDALERRTLLAGFSPIGLGSAHYDSGYETATDSAGNVIVAGVFSGTVNFGSRAGESLAAVMLTAVGETDIFVAKYSAT